MMEAVANGVLSQALVLAENLSDEHDLKAPKKRAETWVQEEIRALIAYRKEMDSLFNTTKSNRHLWEIISCKMKDRGFDRSPTMCIDKWRNLLKEYKKMKQHDKAGANKVGCYRDLEDLLSERAKLTPYRSPKSSEQQQQLSPTVMGRRLEQDGHSSDAGGVSNGLSSWHWRDAGNRLMYNTSGKIIHVKMNGVTKRVGIDASPESIRDTIKAAFGLRTRRAFWLEDDDGTIWSIDRDMPIGDYNLRLDEGVTVKVCVYDEGEGGVMRGVTEEKTLYTEDDLRDFLGRRGWSGLREVGGVREFEFLHELHPLCVYERSGLLGQ